MDEEYELLVGEPLGHGFDDVVGFGVVTGFGVVVGFGHGWEGSVGLGVGVGLPGHVVAVPGVLISHMSSAAVVPPHVLWLPLRAVEVHESWIPPAKAAGAAARVRTVARVAAPRMFLSFTTAFPLGAFPSGNQPGIRNNSARCAAPLLRVSGASHRPSAPHLSVPSGRTRG